MHVKCKKRTDTSSKRGKWNHVKVTRKIPEQTIKELQKTAILGTALLLQKVLMQKYRTFNVGNTMTCIRNYNYRTAATLYTTETLFVLDTNFKYPA